VGQLGKLRPIDNRPTALFAPGSGGNQPPRRLGGYHRQTQSAAYSGIGGYHRQSHWTTNGGIGGYHCQTHSATNGGIGGYHCETHSATNGGIHQYPPVSTEAASLPT
jgi:hypothetical protein